jgi:general secretion pathway protein G
MTISQSLVWSPERKDVKAISSQKASIRAFTLMEILIVLAILGLLVGLSVTKLGGVLDGARINTAKIFINDSMKAPLFTYKMQVGDFPSTEEGLQALLVAPANKADRWQGPYLEVNGGKLPLDPWGEPYMYRYPGTHNKGSYDIWSKGPDKVDGNDDDIGNW